MKLYIVNADCATHVTHAGMFHADEVFATAILLRVKSEGEMRLARVFSIPEGFRGMAFDIGNGMYDHHQKVKLMRTSRVPYAAAGLIWRDFGKAVLRNVGCPERHRERVMRTVDSKLFYGIDAVDNGVMETNAFSVSQVISQLNPCWDESTSVDEAFCLAVKIADSILMRVIETTISTAMAADEIEKAIDRAEDGIIRLDQFLPWQNTFFASRNPKTADALFVVYPSNRGDYNIQGIPKNLGSRITRCPAPDEWCGLGGETLAATTGVDDAVFCHPSGFLMSAKTKEGAIRLGMIAIEKGGNYEQQRNHHNV